MASLARGYTPLVFTRHLLALMHYDRAKARGAVLIRQRPFPLYDITPYVLMQIAAFFRTTPSGIFTLSSLFAPSGSVARAMPSRFSFGTGFMKNMKVRESFMFPPMPFSLCHFGSRFRRICLPPHILEYVCSILHANYNTHY